LGKNRIFFLLHEVAIFLKCPWFTFRSFVAEVVPNFQKISVLEGTGLKYADKSSESLEGYNKL